MFWENIRVGFGFQYNPVGPGHLEPKAEHASEPTQNRL